MRAFEALPEVEAGDYGLVLVDDLEGFWVGTYDDEFLECENYNNWAACPTCDGGGECGAETHCLDRGCGHEEMAIVIDDDGCEAHISFHFIRALGEIPMHAPFKLTSPEHDGWFYAVLVAPELSMTRVKMGFTKNPVERMRNYHTSSPTALLLGAWPIAKAREMETMAALAATAKGRVFRREVFEIPDLNALLIAADARLR